MWLLCSTAHLEESGGSGRDYRPLKPVRQSLVHPCLYFWNRARSVADGWLTRFTPNKPGVVMSYHSEVAIVVNRCMA